MTLLLPVVHAGAARHGAAAAGSPHGERRAPRRARRPGLRRGRSRCCCGRTSCSQAQAPPAPRVEASTGLHGPPGARLPGPVLLHPGARGSGGGGAAADPDASQLCGAGHRVEGHVHPRTATPPSCHAAALLLSRVVTRPPPRHSSALHPLRLPHLPALRHGCVLALLPWQGFSSSSIAWQETQSLLPSLQVSPSRCTHSSRITPSKSSGAAS